MRMLPGFVGVALATSGAYAEPKMPPAPRHKQVVSQLPDEVQCPASLDGVTLDLQPADHGVVLELVRPNKDYVAQLRQLVREAAELVEQHTNGTLQNASSKLDIPPVQIKIADIPNGTRVTLRSLRPADVKKLRRQAMTFEQFWDEFECVNGP